MDKISVSALIRSIEYSAEHLFAVRPDNLKRDQHEKVRVLGLRIRPKRVVELEVQQSRQQDATARFGDIAESW